MSTIFITGATSGIGRATAEKFLREGWNVIAAGRRESRLRELAETPHAGKLLPLVLDVCDKAAVDAAVAGLKPPFAPVDVLVNNAGLALGVAVAQESNADDWNTMVDTNIKGVLHCTHAVLPDMVARNTGHIVNIGSIAGSYAYVGGNVYGATKAFVEQFSRNLRCDLHGTDVRVTNIEPGLLESEFTLVRLKGNVEGSRKLYEDAEPLHPEDIAECIWWAIQRPAHVNICRIEVMPVCQRNGATQVFRKHK
ncbi:MAG TPA: SDR family NAD(P)-dependent oxidoreductase [Candidatus Avidesulfovibrio excrementigallinarum]|nr:SDR family NAD(P)-dependent oxidoreductase [Candidatus Avidesulfovibrio excrementigallinarum]